MHNFKKSRLKLKKMYKVKNCNTEIAKKSKFMSLLDAINLKSDFSVCNAPSQHHVNFLSCTELKFSIYSNLGLVPKSDWGLCFRCLTYGGGFPYVLAKSIISARLSSSVV